MAYTKSGTIEIDRHWESLEKLIEFGTVLTTRGLYFISRDGSSPLLYIYVYIYPFLPPSYKYYIFSTSSRTNFQ